MENWQVNANRYVCNMCASDISWSNSLDSLYIIIDISNIYSHKLYEILIQCFFKCKTCIINLCNFRVKIILWGTKLMNLDALYNNV